MTTENQILKIAGVENYEKDWKQLFDNDKVFIFKFKKVFELKHNEKKGFYATEIKELRKPKGANTIPYVGRGRFVAFNKKQADNLIKA